MTIDRFIEACHAANDAASARSLSREERLDVVVAPRNEWFASRVAGTLEAQGVCVAARLQHGADAVGAVIAEQPDVLLVEEALAMVPGEDGDVAKKILELLVTSPQAG